MYGKTGCRDYTNSLKTVMMLALPEQNSNPNSTSSPAKIDNHDNCPQAKYQKKYHPSVQSKNRFDVFNTNLGNY